MNDCVRSRTSALRRWFGNSKVATRGGAPRVMYHATMTDFTAFDTSRSDLGAHFGSKEQANNIVAQRLVSSGARGPLILLVYLRIENPLRLKDVGSFHADGIAPQLERKGLLPKGSGKRIVKEIDRDWKLRRKYDPMLRELIEKAGYDGIVYANTAPGEGKGDCYIAFHPEQIKSAIGNSGAFDPANPDISDSQSAIEDPLARRQRQPSGDEELAP